MAEKRLKVAVIGVGSLGQHHAKIFNSLPESELVAVVDVDKARAKQIGTQFSVPYYYDYTEVVDQVDAVGIVVNTVYHYDVAKFFLEKGKHTLVEKPITTTVSQAEELISIADKNNLVLQVGHVERFNPAVMKLKEIVKNPLYIEMDRLGAFSQRSLEVGVVLDLMIHDIDILLSLVPNKIKSIDAIGVPVFTQHEDISNVRISFDNGGLADLSASRVTPDGQRKLRIYQPGAYISLNYQNQEIYIYHVIEEKEDDKVKRDIVFNTLQVLPGEPLRLELKNFVDCVVNDREPVVSGEHGRDALEIAMKITKKIREKWEKTMQKPFL